LTIKNGSAKLRNSDNYIVGVSATVMVLAQYAVISKSSGRRTHRLFITEFRAKVVLAALREDKTWAELCQ